MPAMQTSLHVLFGDLQRFCSLGCAHLFDVTEHDDGAKLFGQTEDRFLQQISELGLRSVLFRAFGLGVKHAGIRLGRKFVKLH